MEIQINQRTEHRDIETIENKYKPKEHRTKRTNIKENYKAQLIVLSAVQY